MERKLSKKAKIFLSIASAIITNTAVAALLTSCSLSNKIDDIGGFDKEYGINNATYTRMEEDFEILYRSQLDQRKESGEINDEAYDLNLYAFQNKLNSLHTSLYSGENKTLSYTIKTNVLRDYARDNYGIRLSRQSSVILDEAIKNIKSSIVSSVLLMCNEYRITDTSEYHKNVEVEFERLKNEAKDKYGDADVVSIIQYIQNGMATCFEGICKELDCLATQQRLKQFIEKYSISVKKDVADDYCWDKLFSKYGDGNKEISAEDFNDIFEISCEELDPQNVYGSYVFASRKIVEFKNNIIPGYTLKPILIKMNSNSYTNTYSIDVDYTLVNDNYINNENVAQLTAHSSALKNKSFYENENTSFFDLNASDEEREYTNYVLPITKEYEQQQINATYFNNENFKFSWSTSEEYGYDDFWTEENENREYKSKLNVSSLATSGMMINGVLLSEILSQVGKISLSGGSYELNGVGKKGGNDTNQWKLTIDNKEVDKDIVEWKLISPTNEKLPNSISITNGIVSWTDQIEVGTYQFCILAKCKEAKIQSAPITLTISSKDAKNIENFNHNTKNTLFDENTIDQKLLDFVNNLNFSLDYTEQDYDTDIDGKKGEIQVDNFNIGYKNSDNTFKALSSINEVISNAINNDSGITTRYNDSLYENVKASYDNVVSMLDTEKINENINSVHDEISSYVQKFYITMGVFTAFNVICLTIAILLANKASRRGHFDIERVLLPWVVGITILTVVATIIDTLLRIDIPLNKLSDKLDEFDPKKQSSCTIVRHISSDKKYLYNDQGEPDKTKFNKLSSSELRELKFYYESGYKSIKNDAAGAETESDLAEYFGSKKGCEELIEDLKDVSGGFRWVYIVAGWCGILPFFITYLILCVAADAYRKYLRDLNADDISMYNPPPEGQIERIEWIRKPGFFQKLVIGHNTLQLRIRVFFYDLYDCLGWRV